MQHTRPYQYNADLAAELIRHGWPAIPDDGACFLDGGPHPKYPLITLRKFRTDKWDENCSRAVLQVAGHVCRAVKSKVHVVDLKRPQWKRTLQRWFGAVVMELMNEHAEIRRHEENRIRKAQKERQALQQIHPCSDRVAETIRVRANVSFGQTITADKSEPCTTLHAHLMHRYETLCDPQAIALFIQLVNYIESKDPGSMADL